MRYTCVALDFDGTLASEGKVPEEVFHALSRLKHSGRRLILATGRRLEDLFDCFPNVGIFDTVVSENGAVLYNPASKEVKLLTEPPLPKFIETLRGRGIANLEVGHVIVATWHPHETIVLEVIQEMGLDLHITFNKGAVMILPPEINKGSGVIAALKRLGISHHNLVSVGDAENDHSMFSSSECAVAVANALPNVKAHADITTHGDHGQGVIELIDRILENDLRDCENLISRHQLKLGTDDDGSELKFNAYNSSILLAGPSQSGKSTIAMSLLEQFSSAGYQYCVIDPEGEYLRAPRAVFVGNQNYAPDVGDVLRALDNPDDNVVVNLLSIELTERATFLNRLMSELQDMRLTRGRPHWVVIDEAHHMLHPYWDETVEPSWNQPGSVVLITIDPSEISRKVLSGIDILLAVGQNAGRTLKTFADCTGHSVPDWKSEQGGWGRAVAWFRHEYGRPVGFRVECSPVEHHRHLRKYAAGDVGFQRSFYFTGPENRFKIRCQNLFLFMQIADGLDDVTWQYHLRRGDYSNWFRNIIRDAVLANETSQLENNDALSAVETKKRVRELIEQRYAPPARLLR